MLNKLRIVSYNIHKGFDRLGLNFVLDSIRNAIRAVDADFVFLQEVQGHHESRPTEKQFEFLADTVWNHHVYGMNAVYPKGHHGNAILSKYPIIGWENLDISSGSYEDRGLLHATVFVPELNIHIHLMNVHMSLFSQGRSRQVMQISNYIKNNVDENLGLILAGDFNDWGRRVSSVLKKEINLLECFEEKTGSAAKTFPSFFPFLSLDRVYIKNFKIDSARVLSDEPWSFLSDHCPIQVELIC